jgi:hypothetical protein
LAFPIESDGLAPLFLKPQADWSWVFVTDDSSLKRGCVPDATGISHQENLGGIVEFFKEHIPEKNGFAVFFEHPFNSIQ